MASKHIVVRLSGGLGNQMFQYAFGRALSIARQCPLILSTHALSSTGNQVTSRRYALDAFLLNTAVTVDASPFDVRLNRIARRLPPLQRALGLHHERDGDFYPAVLQDDRAHTFDGYWQSPLYFQSIADTLCQEFRLRESPPTKEFSALSEAVSQPGTVMLHIRRGDYVTLASASAHHGALDLTYYERAMTTLAARVPNPKVFVFSDDIAWCKRTLAFLPEGSVFVEPDVARSDAQELVLMSRCHHHIIANSSFSWWAAWLADRQVIPAGRIVCAPTQWFAHAKAKAASRFCPHWTAL